MAETLVHNEKEMRDSKAPSPQTIAELSDYIHSLVEGEHDYGTCVYAMSLAATAAFQYVAGQLGVTGSQASCADMDVLRRTRSMECPFLILKAEDDLFPQYDLPGRLAEARENWKPWLREQAAKKLKAPHGAHPAVIAHWKALARQP